ncbi:hypothetical protein J8273_8496 [Carpediemonas membranifera]|uniref:Uncharacterized protein n=1 Tax=Carpediemonas membranifera TaxID=201153 RepID=A0A8J6B4F8_9EUKA|nr:hypothetical protein J8273_8496 [Carpediemonas membranifera]|eukprot:KAG9389817.1 hypothetical protein J8273_8496 [Carpediemonas membranifera]
MDDDGFAYLSTDDFEDESDIDAAILRTSAADHVSHVMPRANPLRHVSSLDDVVQTMSEQYTHPVIHPIRRTPSRPTLSSIQPVPEGRYDGSTPPHLASPFDLNPALNRAFTEWLHRDDDSNELDADQLVAFTSMVTVEADFAEADVFFHREQHEDCLMVALMISDRNSRIPVFAYTAADQRTELEVMAGLLAIARLLPVAGFSISLSEVSAYFFIKLGHIMTAEVEANTGSAPGLRESLVWCVLSDLYGLRTDEDPSLTIFETIESAIFRHSGRLQELFTIVTEYLIGTRDAIIAMTDEESDLIRRVSRESTKFSPPVRFDINDVLIKAILRLVHDVSQFVEFEPTLHSVATQTTDLIIATLGRLNTIKPTHQAVLVDAVHFMASHACISEQLATRTSFYRVFTTTWPPYLTASLASVLNAVIDAQGCQYSAPVTSIGPTLPAFLTSLLGMLDAVRHGSTRDYNPTTPPFRYIQTVTMDSRPHGLSQVMECIIKLAHIPAVLDHLLGLNGVVSVGEPPILDLLTDFITLPHQGIDCDRYGLYGFSAAVDARVLSALALTGHACYTAPELAMLRLDERRLLTRDVTRVKSQSFPEFRIVDARWFQRVADKLFYAPSNGREADDNALSFFDMMCTLPLLVDTTVEIQISQPLDMGALVRQVAPFPVVLLALALKQTEPHLKHAALRAFAASSGLVYTTNSRTVGSNLGRDLTHLDGRVTQFLAKIAGIGVFALLCQIAHSVQDTDFSPDGKTDSGTLITVFEVTREILIATNVSQRYLMESRFIRNQAAAQAAISEMTELSKAAGALLAVCPPPPPRRYYAMPRPIQEPPASWPCKRRAEHIRDSLKLPDSRCSFASFIEACPPTQPCPSHTPHPGIAQPAINPALTHSLPLPASNVHRMWGRHTDALAGNGVTTVVSLGSGFGVGLPTTAGAWDSTGTHPVIAFDDGMVCQSTPGLEIINRPLVPASTDPDLPEPRRIIDLSMSTDDRFALMTTRYCTIEVYDVSAQDTVLSLHGPDHAAFAHRRPDRIVVGPGRRLIGGPFRVTGDGIATVIDPAGAYTNGALIDIETKAVVRVYSHATPSRGPLAVTDDGHVFLSGNLIYDTRMAGLVMDLPFFGSSDTAFFYNNDSAVYSGGAFIDIRSPGASLSYQGCSHMRGLLPVFGGRYAAGLVSSYPDSDTLHLVNLRDHVTESECSLNLHAQFISPSPVTHKILVGSQHGSGSPTLTVLAIGSPFNARETWKPA